MGPPKPRYTHTWDVRLVQKYLDCLGKTTLLPLKLLSIKLAMLFALSCPERTWSLTKLDLRHCQVLPQKEFFLHTCISEKARLSRSTMLCLFHTMRDSAPLALWRPYLKVTVDLQSAFRKMLCLRAALEKTMVNYISLES